MLRLVGTRAYVQPELCVMVTVWSATVTVAVRAAPVFAATVKLTVPLALPVPPEITVSQLALLVAVQEQLPAPVTFTLTLALPLLAATV